MCVGKSPGGVWPPTQDGLWGTYTMQAINTNKSNISFYSPLLQEKRKCIQVAALPI